MRAHLINNCVGYSDAKMKFLTTVRFWVNPLNPTEPYIDADATYTQVISSLDWLINNSDSNDVVYIALKDHGAVWSFCTLNMNLPYFTMGQKLNAMSAPTIIVEIMACHSGSAQSHLNGSGRLICLSCQHFQSSYGVPPWYDLYDSLTVAAADTNWDGLISVEEAHAHEALTIPNPTIQTPVIDDQIPGHVHF